MQDDLIERCVKCDRLGDDCGEHDPTWEELAGYWRERYEALEADNARLRGREAELYGQLMRMVDRWEELHGMIGGESDGPTIDHQSPVHSTLAKLKEKAFV